MMLMLMAPTLKLWRMMTVPVPVPQRQMQAWLKPLPLPAPQWLAFDGPWVHAPLAPPAQTVLQRQAAGLPD